MAAEIQFVPKYKVIVRGMAAEKRDPRHPKPLRILMKINSTALVYIRPAFNYVRSIAMAGTVSANIELFKPCAYRDILRV